LELLPQESRGRGVGLALHLHLVSRLRTTDRTKDIKRKFISKSRKIIIYVNNNGLVSPLHHTSS
jgi:hypothetical protein